jgi:hypothetical protein
MKLYVTCYRRKAVSPHALGLELDLPDAVELLSNDGDTVLWCRERRADGKRLGELEVTRLTGALVIDRDGVLEERARTAVAREAAQLTGTIAVHLPGAAGQRADGVIRGRTGNEPRPELPYIYVLALAPHDLVVQGGLLVVVRCAAPEWAAGDTMLQSLRLVGLRGPFAAANDEPGDSALPLIGRRE